MTQPQTHASLLALLSVAFPSGGADEKQLTLYLDQLKRAGVRADDLSEAVQRIIHTRETRTYPPLAEILRRCRESQADRLKARDALEIAEGQRSHTPDDRESFDVWRGLDRLGVTHCDELGWMVGTRCQCNVGRTLAEPLRCWGEGVPLSEAKAKLTWAREHVEPPPAKDAPEGFELPEVEPGVWEEYRRLNRETEQMRRGWAKPEDTVDLSTWGES